MKSNQILTAFAGILIGGLGVWLITTRLPSNNDTNTSQSVPTDPPVATIIPTQSDVPLFSPTPTTTPTPSPIWSSYSNPVFNYELSYDPSWMLNTHPSGSNIHERVILQGDISTVGWPSINISRVGLDPAPTTLTELETTLTNIFGSSATITTTTFGQGMISAIKLSTSASPQAYATETYYFFHNSTPLMISLNDTSSSSLSTYSRFLSSFSLL